MKRAIFVVSMGALFQPAIVQAADDEPRVLSPASAWTLDFADERCSLIREFADDDDRIRLQIDSFGPGRSGYRVMLSGGAVPVSDSAPLTELRVAYSPDTRERERFTVIGGKFQGQAAVSFGRGFLPDAGFAADLGPAAEISDMPGVADERRREFERSVSHMTLAFRLRKPLRLDTGNMAAPFAGLRLCVDDLVASWGIDPAVYQARSRSPQPVDPTLGLAGTRVFAATGGDGDRAFELVERDGERVEERDHLGPRDRRARQVAASAFYSGSLIPLRVMIDAAGQPTSCVAQVALASDAVRQKLCEQFAGPYEPALDAEGRPMASFLLFQTR